MQDLNVKRWMESGAYQQQKEIINGEVNSLKMVNGFAAITLANPGRTMAIDYSVFKKGMSEKMKLYTLKKQHKPVKMKTIGRFEF